MRKIVCAPTLMMKKRYEIEWIGREGLAPETHEEYLNDFINHFYKNVLRCVSHILRVDTYRCCSDLWTEP